MTPLVLKDGSLDNQSKGEIMFEKMFAERFCVKKFVWMAHGTKMFVWLVHGKNSLFGLIMKKIVLKVPEKNDVVV